MSEQQLHLTTADAVVCPLTEQPCICGRSDQELGDGQASPRRPVRAAWLRCRAAGAINADGETWMPGRSAPLPLTPLP